MSDHEFGGQHTEIKLAVVESYLKAFTQALRSQFSQLWYIDAFAGSGTRITRTIENPGGLFGPSIVERIKIDLGSASIGLAIQPHFDRVIFVEQNSAFCDDLRTLAARYPGRQIDIIEDDANAAIRKLLTAQDWKSARGVLFLDPYGMEVEWATLEVIAATKAIDVWFLFPLSGLFRQATRKLTAIDAYKRAALTRTFGSDRWEEELYAKEQSQTDMFGVDAERERRATVADLERYVHGRLQDLFAKVLKPLALPVDSKPQRFSLFLCISNPDPKAIGLATRIGNHILNSGRNGISS